MFIWNYVLTPYFIRKVIYHPFEKTNNNVLITFKELIDIYNKVNSEVQNRLCIRYDYCDHFVEEKIIEMTYPVQLVCMQKNTNYDDYIGNLSNEQLTTLLNIVKSMCVDYRRQLVATSMIDDDAFIDFKLEE